MAVTSGSRQWKELFLAETTLPGGDLACVTWVALVAAGLVVLA